jgi:methyl-accepting chemotaxis protein
MNWFLNLPIRAKLFLVFGVLVALFAIALGVAYSSVNNLLAVQAELRAKQANVSDFSKVEANHNEGRVNVLMMFATPDKNEQVRWIAAVRKEHAENRENLTRIETRNAGNPAITSKLREYLAMREIYATTRERAFELILAGNIDEARRITLSENNDRYLAMRAMTNEFTRDSDLEASGSLVQAKVLSDAARQKFVILSIAVLAGSFFGVFVLGRLIADPVQKLVAAARRVSAGDLRITVEAQNRHDEVGVLADSFGTMLQNFRAVHGEIQDSVNVIASAASEISTATSEMAATATETATAVSQTSTTVEQVKQTAQVSAQKAGHVADVAQKAAQSAQAGRKAVDESVGGMQNIREQMELIADTIVRLSEQSQAIGEIISSVNDLAEQSNLLAVNASIEAAKAGEHGRGFAVVAQEIRSLASQSKESTAQIRTILNDIQKATTAAVMAAEQGSKAVDAGFKQVSQSGESIRALTETIVTAAQAATQITASSQQQLIGVDQVGVAMQSILQASKQNASGTQQAESGARNLSDLGQKLKQLTQRFSV